MHPNGDRNAWLRAGDARCANPGAPPRRPWHVVLLGPPGVGKGTVAAKLVKELAACHLSTGDVFRAARDDVCGHHSAAMESALMAMRRGELVSDETVVQIVRDRVGCLKCTHGFLLDGFPRTLEQARTLDEMLLDIRAHLDAVLLLDAPESVIVERLSGRRICRSCRANWHVAHHPPRVSGICDTCGGELMQREDDQPESVRVRLGEYRLTSGPPIDWYRDRGLLRVVDASASPDEVGNAASAALKPFPEG